MINKISNQQNFAGITRFNLPTKRGLECATNKISRETQKNPSGLFDIFGKLYNLSKSELKGIPDVPMGMELYVMASGKMITKNNPEIQKLSSKILALPNAEQIPKLNAVAHDVGKYINVVIDDTITSY